MPKTINFVKVRVPEGFVVGRDRIDPHNVYGKVETEEATRSWSAHYDSVFSAIAEVATPEQWRRVRDIVAGVVDWDATPADGTMLDEILELITRQTDIIVCYVDDEGWRAANERI